MPSGLCGFVSTSTFGGMIEFAYAFFTSSSVRLNGLVLVELTLNGTYVAPGRKLKKYPKPCQHGAGPITTSPGWHSANPSDSSAAHVPAIGRTLFFWSGSLRPHAFERNCAASVSSAP